MDKKGFSGQTDTVTKKKIMQINIAIITTFLLLNFMFLSLRYRMRLKYVI